MSCPHCGRAVNPGARFCTSCGEALVAQQSPPPVPDFGIAAAVQPPTPLPAPPPTPSSSPGRRRHVQIAVVALVLVLVAGGLVTYLLATGGATKGDVGASNPPTTAPASSSTTPSPDVSSSDPSTEVTTASPTPPTSPSDPYGVEIDVPLQQSDCVSAATDDLQGYLAEQGCVSLTRGLYRATVSSRPALISAVEIVLATPADVPAFAQLVLADGTGHIDTLIDDGLGAPGDPPTFAADATYVAGPGSVSGEVVVLEGMWLDGATSANDPGLTTLLNAVLNNLR